MCGPALVSVADLGRGVGWEDLRIPLQDDGGQITTCPGLAAAGCRRAAAYCGLQVTSGHLLLVPTDANARYKQNSQGAGTGEAGGRQSALQPPCDFDRQED